MFNLRSAIFVALLSGCTVIAHGATREFPLAVIRNQCIDFSEVKRGNEPDDLRDCRVSEFQEFGSVDGETYYYALYCLILNDAPDKGKCGDGSFNSTYHRERGLAVFVRAASRSSASLLFERVTEEVGMLLYERPQIIRTAAGIILHLAIAVDGTGNFNESEYFLRGQGVWEPIEAKEWIKDLPRRIPSGLEIRKGIWPDIKTMQASAGLYRRDDANCCPTGGVARIRLALRGKQFAIDSVVVEAAK
jgi:hypothetical protein